MEFINVHFTGMHTKPNQIGLIGDSILLPVDAIAYCAPQNGPLYKVIIKKSYMDELPITYDSAMSYFGEGIQVVGSRVYK